MLTVEVMLRLRDAAASDALDALLPAEADRLRTEIVGLETRVAFNLIHHRAGHSSSDSALAEFDEVASLGGLPPTWERVPLDSFDAVLELRHDSGERAAAIVTSLDGLVDRLGNQVDGERSCLAMGFEHTIIEGSGPVQLFYCFRAKPPVTHEEFLEFWRHKLTEQTTKTPSKTGYIQLHIDVELTKAAAKAAGVGIDGYDGVALEWYPSLDGFMSAVRWASDPDAAIIASESNINDFKSSLAMLAQSES